MTAATNASTNYVNLRAAWSAGVPGTRKATLASNSLCATMAYKFDNTTTLGNIITDKTSTYPISSKELTIKIDRHGALVLEVPNLSQIDHNLTALKTLYITRIILQQNLVVDYSTSATDVPVTFTLTNTTVTPTTAVVNTAMRQLTMDLVLSNAPIYSTITPFTYTAAPAMTSGDLLAVGVNGAITTPKFAMAAQTSGASAISRIYVGSNFGGTDEIISTSATSGNLFNLQNALIAL